MDGITSVTRTVNYESKTRAVDSKTPVSFSLRIREVERNLVRNGSGRRENLVKQRTVASPAIGFEIPSCFLAGEETCRGYVEYALSKTVIASWIQPFILPQICKDAIQEGKRSGFRVEAQVEAVKETYFNNCIDLNDYDSEGRRIRAEPDCPICLQEFGRRIITKLRCCDHSFHRHCILTWLDRKPSCPTCRDDIHNPRPKKFTQKKKCFDSWGVYSVARAANELVKANLWRSNQILSRHNDEQPLNITGQLILNGQNDFQYGQVSYRAVESLKQA